MNARDEIMAAIRQGLRSAYLPGATEAPLSSDRPPPERTSGDVDTFQTEAELVGAEVHRVAGTQEAAQKVIKLVKDAGAKRVLTWSETAIGVDGLQAALSEAGIGWQEPEQGAHPSTYETFEVGLSGADAALADVGALVLVSGPGRARSASLLPPLHIALLFAEQIYADMAAYWAAHSDAAGKSSNLVFIAGPSRSADIELTLSIGVHGPGVLHIIVIGAG